MPAQKRPVVYRIWICRCQDGHYWPRPPRHAMCALCGSGIHEVGAVTLSDALSYPPASLRVAGGS